MVVLQEEGMSCSGVEAGWGAVPLQVLLVAVGSAMPDVLFDDGFHPIVPTCVIRPEKGGWED